MRFYNDKINKYFLNPKHSGSLDNSAPNVFTVQEGSLKLGRLIIFQIMLDSTKSYIKNVKYKIYGCGATIATFDWLAGKIINQDVIILDNIKIEDITRALDLPEDKLSCALIAEDILKKLQLLIK